MLQPALLTVKQVAALLSIGETTVYRLKDAGELPYLKFGGAIRFEPSDVDAYKQKCKRQENASAPRVCTAPRPQRGFARLAQFGYRHTA